MSLMALENCSCSWWVLLPVPAAEPVSCSLIFSSAAALKKIKNIFFNRLKFLEDQKQINFLIQTDNTNCKTHLHKTGVTTHGE